MNNTTPNGWSPTNTCTNCPGFETSDCCGGNGFQHNGWNPNFSGFSGPASPRATPWNNAWNTTTPWNTPWNNAFNTTTPWNTPWNNAFNTTTPWNTPWNNAWNTTTPWNTPWNNAWNNAWNTCLAPNTTGAPQTNTTATPTTNPTQNTGSFNGGWHTSPNHGHAGLNTPNTNTPSHASHGTAFGPNSAGWNGTHANQFGGPTTTAGQGNWFPNANPFGWNDTTHTPMTTITNTTPSTNECNGGRSCEQTNDCLPQGMKVRSVA